MPGDCLHGSPKLLVGANGITWSRWSNLASGKLLRLEVLI